MAPSPRPSHNTCRAEDHPLLGRRELLRVGGLGLLGVGLADLLRLEAHATEGRTRLAGKAKSVVFIFQSGGPSQHETFDPKPDAPAEIRGEYGTTATKLSGDVFTPGRHDWGDVFPCFFAGGGIRPDQSIGQTDKEGGVPVTDAYTPADLAATILHQLGIGPETEFHDAQGRPYRFSQGVPIRGLI